MTRPPHLLLIIMATALLTAATLRAQQRNSVYQEYIDTYSDMAIDQMRRHHIPASITMAQALLESGAGRKIGRAHV